LVAGVITFALGVFAAYLLLHHEFAVNRRADFEEFQNLASEVNQDLLQIQALLKSWADQVKAKQRLDPIDSPRLTWDIDQTQLHFIFAKRGVQRTTQMAIDWFKQAEKLARLWNSELPSLTEGTQRQAMRAVSGAAEKVTAASESLRKVARL
jgi:hypothetical protein